VGLIVIIPAGSGLMGHLVIGSVERLKEKTRCERFMFLAVFFLVAWSAWVSTEVVSVLDGTETRGPSATFYVDKDKIHADEQGLSKRPRKRRLTGRQVKEAK